MKVVIPKQHCHHCIQCQTTTVLILIFASLFLFGIPLRMGTRLRQYNKSSSSSSSAIFLYEASVSLNFFKSISSATSLFMRLPLLFAANNSVHGAGCLHALIASLWHVGSCGKIVSYTLTNRGCGGGEISEHLVLLNCSLWVCYQHRHVGMSFAQRTCTEAKMKQPPQIWSSWTSCRDIFFKLSFKFFSCL